MHRANHPATPFSPERFAFDRSAPLRSDATRFTLRSNAPLRFDPNRFVAFRSTHAKSASARSASGAIQCDRYQNSGRRELSPTSTTIRHNWTPVGGWGSCSWQSRRCSRRLSRSRGQRRRGAGRGGSSRSGARRWCGGFRTAATRRSHEQHSHYNPVPLHGLSLSPLP